MGRRAHAPDPVSRRQVEALAGYGIPEAEIAGLIGIDAKTLRKHYRAELDHGHTKANAKVAENLFRKATGEGRQAVVAAIFWLKTRAGWKETSVSQITGKYDGPPTIVLRQMTQEDVDTHWRDEALSAAGGSKVVARLGYSSTVSPFPCAATTAKAGR